MITPAVSTPSSIIGKAFFSLSPRSADIREPVHAPVPGRGIATRMNSPSISYFSITSILFSARFSSFSAIPARNLLFFFIQSNILRTNRMINGTGSIFPMTLTASTPKYGRPFATPYGIAPLSSSTGSAAIPSTHKYFTNTLMKSP